MKTEKLFKSLDSPVSGGVIYSLAALLPMVLSLVFIIIIVALEAAGSLGENYTSEDWYIYCGYLLAQIAFFAIILAAKKYFSIPLKQIYRPAKAKYFGIAIAAQFGLFSLSFVNSFFIEFLQKLGLSYSGDSLLPSLEGGGIVLAILVIAVLPAIMEETVFRSLMLSSMKKLGTVWCVLICGLLFSLVHHSPAQTVYQFICGCVFALVAIRSDSVLPTVVSHFLNNAFVIIMCRLGFADTVLPMPFYIVSGVFFVASMVYLIFIDKSGGEKGTKGKGTFFAAAAVGIIYNVILWIVELVG